MRTCRSAIHHNQSKRFELHHERGIEIIIGGGADSAQVRAALLGGFADSTILRQHAARMIARDFVPGGPAKYQIKDTKTALGFAQSLRLELPVLGLVDGLFTDMVEHGDGELDHSALILELRRRNGLPVS
jgi:3-hydroxyisobutyrate dehydrogenase-like beta-hydroxyacid dehydrogenase